jgi:hypothetical protein
MAADLSAFQSAAPSTPSTDLADVLQSMTPAFAKGFAYSCRLSQDQHGRHLEVVLMHASGWDVSSSVLLDADSDPFAMAGLLLAGLLGIRVGESVATAQQQPEVCEELEALIQQADLAAAAVEPEEQEEELDLIGEGSPDHPVPAEQLQPLSKADQATCIAMLKALQPAARQSFTVAFRSHFNVDKSERTISKLITQVQHKLFIQGFLDELELQEAA